MSSVKRAVQSSLHAINTAEQSQKRRLELRTIQNPLKRAAMLAMHATVERQPACVADLLKLDYLPADLRHLANGNQSSVYRRGDTVLKVINPSMTMSENERTEFINTESQRHGLLIEHVGQLALPQHMFTGRHPILRAETAVQIKQPFVTGYDPGLFTEAHGAINTERLIALEEKYPDSLASLRGFALRSIQLYEETGLLADTNGARNIIIREDQSCMLIDATPIGTEHAAVQSVILAQTKQLAAL